MKKYIPLLSVFIVGSIIGAGLPDMLSLSLDETTWQVRAYRAYYMVFGGLIVFYIDELFASKGG